MTARRWAAWLAGVWTGLMCGIGFVGAPSAFATLAPEFAGRVAARMFAIDAPLSLALAMALFLLLRREARSRAAQGRGSVFSTDMLLALGGLFCTVAGYYALQPMMEAARLGQGSVSFAALHGVSAGLFSLKALLAAILAWRLARP